MIAQVSEGPDAGAAWHYGDPFGEQRAIIAGTAGVDLSHHPVFTITGPDRLTWLNDITSQKFTGLAPSVPTSAYILDSTGRIIHGFSAVDDGNRLVAHTEPGQLEPLLGWLNRMVFAARVEIGVDPELALVLPPGGAAPTAVLKTEVEPILGEQRAGIWAMEAIRIAAGLPRLFLDIDSRTIPNELANPEQDSLGPWVHLNKGCYPGQETVARVYNLGRPPRRLTLLHLDGSVDRLPPVGDPVLADGLEVGRMGSSERHYELGPIGLALIKRSVEVDAVLSVAGIAATQQVLVDPDAGLHWRPEAGLGRV